MCDPCKRSNSSPQRGYGPHVENHCLRGKAVKEPGMEVKLAKLDLPSSCPLLSPLLVGSGNVYTSLSSDY